MNSNYSEALKRCTDSPEQMNAHEGTKGKEKKEHKGERERTKKKKEIRIDGGQRKEG